jgi:hypothetical protein
MAEWVVPNVYPPSSAFDGRRYADGTYKCLIWVGLDGTHGTHDVLQAGVRCTVKVVQGGVGPSVPEAFIEWYPHALTPVPHSDFDVRTGDTILCSVCAPFGNAHGTVTFVNRTTGKTMTHGIDPPPGVTSTGNTAEWIVEDPGAPTGGKQPFANYGSVTFRNCAAGTKHHSLDLRSACPMNMLDRAGNVMSHGEIESSTSVTCTVGTV